MINMWTRKDLKRGKQAKMILNIGSIMNLNFAWLHGVWVPKVMILFLDFQIYISAIVKIGNMNPY